MADALAGFDFSIEFSESIITRLLKTLFDDLAVPTRFNHDDGGQPGVLSTKQTVGGKLAYERYLIEIEAGYNFKLFDPVARLVGGAQQNLELDLGFGLKLPRNVVTRIYDATNLDTSLAPDPGDVKQNVAYAEEHRTAPADNPYPGATAPYNEGRIRIALPLVQRPWATGRRVSGQAAAASRQAVVSVRLDGSLDARLKTFLEVVASKALTELIRREVDDYDLTPMVGNLDAFGLKLRDPVALRVGESGGARYLAFAAHEKATVGNGDPAQLPFLAGGSDFAVSFREAMFAQLIYVLYQDGYIPRRYAMSGLPDLGGPILIEQPRLSFRPQGLDLACRLDVNGVAISISATIMFTPTPGGLHVSLSNLVVDVQFPGLGFLQLLNTVTFHLLSAIVGEVLASLLEKPISNTLDDGLEAFLASGALAFAFHSPIRGTPHFVAVKPTDFRFVPGSCTLRGEVAIA